MLTLEEQLEMAMMNLRTFVWMARIMPIKTTKKYYIKQAQKELNRVNELRYQIEEINSLFLAA
jgi:hypothetical protein